SRRRHTRLQGDWSSDVCSSDLIASRLDALPAETRVMLKLTIPTTPDFYAPLIKHPKVVRVVALSGGYSRAEACKLLSANHGMIEIGRASCRERGCGRAGADSRG